MASKVKKERSRERNRVQTKTMYKRFVVFPEGIVTEPRYVKILDSLIRKEYPSANLRLTIELPSHSGPKHLLTALKVAIKNGKLDSKDDVWVWVDKDDWEDDQFEHLISWGDQKRVAFYQMAISNPKFELWLLYHFENARGKRTPEEIVQQLKKYIPDYEKNIPEGVLSWQHVLNAVSYAKEKAKACTCSGDENFPHSDVYKMLERLIEMGEKRSKR